MRPACFSNNNSGNQVDFYKRYIVIFAELFPFSWPCDYPEAKHPEILIICSPCQHEITFHILFDSGNPGYGFNAV